MEVARVLRFGNSDSEDSESDEDNDLSIDEETKKAYTRFCEEIGATRGTRRRAYSSKKLGEGQMLEEVDNAFSFLKAFWRRTPELNCPHERAYREHGWTPRRADGTPRCSTPQAFTAWFTERRDLLRRTGLNHKELRAALREAFMRDETLVQSVHTGMGVEDRGGIMPSQLQGVVQVMASLWAKGDLSMVTPSALYDQ